jgi:hypothetical protein
MSEQIVLTLPTDLFQRATTLARESGRPVADLLTEAIERSLPGTDEETPPAELTWSWSKEREKVRQAVREFSEKAHADY